MKLKFLGILGIIFYFTGCASRQDVTQDTYEMLENTFSSFRFYISRDVVLKEIIPAEVASDKRNTRVTITAYNKVVNIKKSTPGRVQGYASSERLGIAFEHKTWKICISTWTWYKI